MANFSAASLVFIKEHTWHCVLLFPPQPQVHLTRFLFRVKKKNTLIQACPLGQQLFCPEPLLARLVSLSNDVFERRKSSGSGLLELFGRDFEQILRQIVSISVKTLRLQIW